MADGDVLTIVAGHQEFAAPAAGGNAHFEYVRTPFAFDSANLAVQAFPITGVDLLTNTVTIAGDHTALFPAGRRAVISGSTGNDYDGYLIGSSSFGAGSTSVVFDPAGALPSDATVDGNLVNNGTAGLTVATLGEGDVLMTPGASVVPIILVLIPEAFDGPATPYLQLYPSDPLLQGYYPLLQNNIDTSVAVDDPSNFEGLWADQAGATVIVYNALYPTGGTGSIVAQLFNSNSHGAPGSTQGRGVIWLPVLRA